MWRVKPGIVVMAKLPVAGTVKTRLCPSLTAKQAAQVAGVFLWDMVANVQAARCADVLIAYTPASSEDWFRQQFPDLTCFPQVEGDQGTKIAGVFEEMEDRDYLPTLVVGTDCPYLPLPLYQQAIDWLLPAPGGSDVVLGPTEDGGYTLIGLQRPEATLFEEIEWGTEHVLSQTLKRAIEGSLRVRQLPRLYDVDTVQDLKRLQLDLSTAPVAPCPRTSKLLSILDIETHPPP